MEIVTRYVMVPLAFAALLSGIVQPPGTRSIYKPWGLTRYGRTRASDKG